MLVTWILRSSLFVLLSDSRPNTFSSPHISSLYIYSNSEDAACIDEALGEDAEHTLVDLAQWRHDEASHSECKAADEHEHGGCDLNVEC